MYSCLYPSRFSNENAASKRLDTRSDAASEQSKSDWCASLAKSGDFPLRAISRMTPDENRREIAANCSDAKSVIFL